MLFADSALVERDTMVEEFENCLTREAIRMASQDGSPIVTADHVRLAARRSEQFGRTVLRRGPEERPGATVSETATPAVSEGDHSAELEELVLRE
jgi:hypothetical protein